MDKNTNKYSISVNWSDENGGWVAVSTEFPRLSGIDEDIHKAISTLQEAIDQSCSLLIGNGDTLPVHNKFNPDWNSHLVKRTLTGTRELKPICDVCGEVMFSVRSGLVCENGHGGAPYTLGMVDDFDIKANEFFRRKLANLNIAYGVDSRGDQLTNENN